GKGEEEEGGYRGLTDKGGSDLKRRAKQRCRGGGVAYSSGSSGGGDSDSSRSAGERATALGGRHEGTNELVDFPLLHLKSPFLSRNNPQAEDANDALAGYPSMLCSTKRIKVDVWASVRVQRLLFGISIHRTDKTTARQFGRSPPLTRDKFDLFLIFRIASSWLWLPSLALRENPSGGYDRDACGGNGIRPILDREALVLLGKVNPWGHSIPPGKAIWCRLLRGRRRRLFRVQKGSDYFEVRRRDEISHPGIR
ncbi:hypothetical protein BHE74_00018144, partial [Ensete ventricosum]